MRISHEVPRFYEHSLPIFDGNNNPTERVFSGFENVMSAYVKIAELSRLHLHQNPKNYEISEVRVVGSGARENRIDSDLDFLLIAPRLDPLSSNSAKVALAMIFYCDISKREAIDVFIRQKEIYPERSSKIITEDVREILDRYNSLLIES